MFHGKKNTGVHVAPRYGSKIANFCTFWRMLTSTSTTNPRFTAHGKPRKARASWKARSFRNSGKLSSSIMYTILEARFYLFGGLLIYVSLAFASLEVDWWRFITPFFCHTSEYLRLRTYMLLLSGYLRLAMILLNCKGCWDRMTEEILHSCAVV